jgi:glycerol-3-phosphate O-acyltransferase
MNWLLRRVLGLWVRFKVRPEDAAALLAGRSHPVCYVLERHSITDLAVLQDACLALKLPRPARRLSGARELRAFFYLGSTRGLWNARPERSPPAQLAQMIAVLRRDPGADFDLVPAAVYWGRAPQKEASWLRLLLVEDWALTSRVRRVMQVLLNGRAMLIEF